MGVCGCVGWGRWVSACACAASFAAVVVLVGVCVYVSVMLSDGGGL